MQAYVKQLLNWRKNNPVIATGKTLYFSPFNGACVYFRYNNKKLVMVVMNKNATPIKITTSRFEEILKGKITCRNIMTNTIINLKDGLMIPAKSALVFEVN